MRLGLSLRSSYAHFRGPGEGRQAFTGMIERTRAARAAGLHCLFVGDHHGTGPYPYAQNTPIMGRLLAEWGDAPAGVLMLLPLWHPVLAAEHLATLANLAAGPFVLQCAVGGGAQQFGAIGTPLAGRGARFEATLEVVTRLLAGDEVTTTVGPFEITSAQIAPLPPARVEVWMGGTAPVTIDRAARLGDAWLGDPGLTPEQARDLADQYRERCAAHGRDPGVIAIRRDVHVGADTADAARVVEPIMERGYRGLPPSSLVHGSAADVTEQLAVYAEMGYTDVLIRHLVDDQTEVLRSFERLATVREALDRV